jgi:hypothetical protein
MHVRLIVSICFLVLVWCTTSTARLGDTGWVPSATAANSKPPKRTTKPPASRPAARRKPALSYPTNDIFLFSVTWKARRASLSGLQRVTNRREYDNQPAFWPGTDEILYASLQDKGQTDVMAYNMKTRNTRRITKTPESEFSPTVLPDGSGLSVVRVERDNTQRLWRIPLLPKPGKPTVLFPKLKPVGYHAWGDAANLAFFILGKPHTLQVANLKTQKALPIAGTIGRSITKIPGERAYGFVHKLAEGQWWIKRLDMDSLMVSMLCRTFPGSEDIAWARQQGVILMAKGSRIYQRDPRDKASKWSLVADLKAKGVRGITRMVFNGDDSKLAIVGLH